MGDCSTRAAFSEGPSSKLERASRMWPVLTLAASQGRSSRPPAQKFLNVLLTKRQMTSSIAHIGGKKSLSQLRH
jgi:hypothetical protein